MGVAEMRNIDTYKPDRLDKMILVHYKYYANIDSVPEKVSQSIMAKAKSWARIKFANFMIVTTLVLALMTVMYAKSHSRQNSLLQENVRRHLQYQKGDDGHQSSRLNLVTSTKVEEE